MENIKESEIDDFSDILETTVEYGFADGDILCELFQVDAATLDELVSGSDTLTVKDWKIYCKQLLKYLKKQRPNYERLYI